jgi:hypothetical protein
MNKVLMTKVIGLAFSCAFFTGIASAGEALDAVNAEVEKKAEQIDQMYGVLLTTQERNDMKVSLVAKKVTVETTADTTETVEEKADSAIATYEITDPTDQRKLLIEMQVVAGGGNDDVKPKPKPKP